MDCRAAAAVPASCSRSVWNTAARTMRSPGVKRSKNLLDKPSRRSHVAAPIRAATRPSIRISAAPCCICNRAAVTASTTRGHGDLHQRAAGGGGDYPVREQARGNGRGQQDQAGCHAGEQEPKRVGKQMPAGETQQVPYPGRPGVRQRVVEAPRLRSQRPRAFAGYARGSPALRVHQAVSSPAARQQRDRLGVCAAEGEQGPAVSTPPASVVRQPDLPAPDAGCLEDVPQRGRDRTGCAALVRGPEVDAFVFPDGLERGAHRLGTARGRPLAGEQAEQRAPCACRVIAPAAGARGPADWLRRRAADAG